MNETQVQQLQQPLDASMVSQRQGASGKMLSYVEGHDCIDACNAIFGYGQWGFDVMANKLETILDPLDNEPCGICYRAIVRLHVQGCEPVSDVGSQAVASWNVADVIMGRRKQGDERPITDAERRFARRLIMEAHEMAEKASVTDALKRALRTFGSQFGNSLYGNGNGGASK